MTTTPCPICAAPAEFLYQARWVHRTSGYRRHIRIMSEAGDRVVEPHYFCDTCGFVFHPETGRPGGAVAREDRSDWLPSLEGHWEERHSGRYIGRNRWIMSHTKAGMRTLDIGCEYGVLVKLLLDQGCFACGIEPHHGKSEAGRQQWGIDITQGLYEVQSFGPNTFDFISAEAVAYYFRPSLKTFSDIAARHIKPGGMLYVQLASTENIGLHFFPNFIRCLVPPGNAASVFARLGWALIDMNTSDFQRGTYGVMLRRTEATAPVPPTIDRRTARNQLMMSDYNLLPLRDRPKPMAAKLMIAALAMIDPTGVLPGLSAKGFNRAWGLRHGTEAFE